jgi:hypothetical protein
LLKVLETASLLFSFCSGKSRFFVGGLNGLQKAWFG